MLFTKIFLIVSILIHSIKGQNIINTPQLIQECLDAHNMYRRQVGVPPLVWDPNLAQQATNYAQHLSDMGMGVMIHSSPSERPNQGENLAYYYSSSSKSARDPYQMITEQWILNERVNFVDNPIPNTMINQLGIETGHYSQCVSRNSKSVGIGVVFKDGQTLMVGRYSPPGNIFGQKPY